MNAHRLQLSSSSLVRSLLLASLATVAVLMLACADGEGTPAAASPGSVPEAGDSCSEVARAVTEAFPDASIIEDEGRYVLGDVEGSGCRTLVTGTSEELPHFVEIARTLGGLLADAGWSEDPNRAADGPTGTLSVYERGDEMAVVSAGSSPVDPSACRPEEVISDCFERLAPSEIAVQGSITVSGG